MNTTATASIYEQLAEEFPEGCTGEEAIQFKRRAGHSFGSPQATWPMALAEETIVPRSAKSRRWQLGI